MPSGAPALTWPLPAGAIGLVVEGLLTVVMVVVVLNFNKGLKGKG